MMLFKNLSGLLGDTPRQSGLTRAKALQTANQFPRETRRRSAVPKSNPLTLPGLVKFIDSTDRCGRFGGQQVYFVNNV
jgi:hypothetical protein